VGWTDLRKADLSRADFSRSRFLHADLRDATLVSADLSDTNISVVDWQRAVLDYARLDGARIENSNFRDASFQQASLEGVQDSGFNLRGPSLAPTQGVTLSVEQRGQLDTSVEVKPIYDRDGKIIGQDVEQTFSPEELEKFFAPVETGSTPSQDVVNLPAPAGDAEPSDGAPIPRSSPRSWTTWQAPDDSTEIAAYSDLIATIGSIDAARRAGGKPANDATSTATATASK
jgi:hypothetical protein